VSRLGSGWACASPRRAVGAGGIAVQPQPPARYRALRSGQVRRFDCRLEQTLVGRPIKRRDAPVGGCQDRLG